MEHMPSPSYFLAYASSASQPFSPQQLVDILAVSRANNERDGITGLLLYRGGNILQSLEGPESQVRETMLRISRDPRHRAVETLYEGYHDARLFGDWSMAFEDVSKLDPSAHPGLNGYLLRDRSVPLVTSDPDHDVFEFFQSFRELVT